MEREEQYRSKEKNPILSIQEDFITFTGASELVKSETANVQLGSSVALSLVGPAGMGKEALFQHLVEEYQQRPDVVVLWLNGAEIDNGQEEPRQMILTTFFSQIADQIGVWRTAATAEDFVERLENFGSKVLVLVNAVEKLQQPRNNSYSLAYWFGYRLIGALSERTPLVLVNIGQERTYWLPCSLWSSHTVKRLAPLTLEEIRGKLVALDLDRQWASVLYQETGGYPAAVSSLIQALAERRLASVTDLQTAARIVLEEAIRGCLCAQFPEEIRTTIEEILFLGALLPALDSVVLADLCQEVDGTGERFPLVVWRGYSYYERIVRLLEDSCLLIPGGSQAMRLMDPAVRYLLALNWWRREPDRCQYCYQLAQQVYQQWHQFNLSNKRVR